MTFFPPPPGYMRSRCGLRLSCSEAKTSLIPANDPPLAYPVEIYPLSFLGLCEREPPSILFSCFIYAIPLRATLYSPKPYSCSLRGFRFLPFSFLWEEGLHLHSLPDGEPIHSPFFLFSKIDMFLLLLLRDPLRRNLLFFPLLHRHIIVLSDSLLHKLRLSRN